MEERWCLGTGSNRRHCDFQSHALPTELPGQTRRTEKAEASGRFIERSGRCVHPASRNASPGAARPALFPQLVGKSWLFRVLHVVLAAGNDIAAAEPAVEVDVAAARRAEREKGLLGGLAADRAGARGGRGCSGLVSHGWDGVYTSWQLRRRSLVPCRASLPSLLPSCPPKPWRRRMWEKVARSAG